MHIIKVTNFKHIIWDLNKNNENIIDTGSDYKRLSGFGMIHLKKRNKFMLFGGRYSFFTPNNDIRMFDLNTFKWNKLDNSKFTQNLSFFECIFTDDEKYLIILNGLGDYKLVNDIYILDFDTMIWKKSDIKTPLSNIGTRSILIDESLSSNGLNYGNNMELFINGLLTKYSIELHIPTDIISILKKMYSKEVIHLLEYTKNDSNHYCIDFEHVLWNQQEKK